MGKYEEWHGVAKYTAKSENQREGGYTDLRRSLTTGGKEGRY